MADCTFKLVLQKDNSYTIELGEYEKLHLLGELKKCYITHCKMSTWLDNNSVPAEQRDAYIPVFLELLHTISFVMNLLKKAGTTDQEIREQIDFPF